ncbi:MAG: 3'-5' exonuclease [Bacteroidetes bacterium]|nr:MAG: 3'-5' exonuclease [Bacteroidota bacterium]
MNFIIFDLEATCWQSESEFLTPEIIEIGAVRMNYYGEILGTFNQFIKPVLHPRLSHFCQELTTIEQKYIDRSRTFPEVVEAFQEWAEIFYEDYLLCSWGSFDKKMLIQDSVLHHLETDWIEKHLNLKRQYHQIRGLRKMRGLKYTVEKEGFSFDGTHHRGIDDAKNLAKIFFKYRDEWQF